jgi:hypothetical protein
MIVTRSLASQSRFEPDGGSKVVVTLRRLGQSVGSILRASALTALNHANVSMDAEKVGRDGRWKRAGVKLSSGLFFLSFLSGQRERRTD